jgi:hypothetical protein
MGKTQRACPPRLRTRDTATEATEATAITRATLFGRALPKATMLGRMMQMEAIGGIPMG